MSNIVSNKLSAPDIIAQTNFVVRDVWESPLVVRNIYCRDSELKSKDDDLSDSRSLQLQDNESKDRRKLSNRLFTSSKWCKIINNSKFQSHTRFGGLLAVARDLVDLPRYYVGRGYGHKICQHR